MFAFNSAVFWVSERAFVDLHLFGRGGVIMLVQKVVQNVKRNKCFAQDN